MEALPADVQFLFSFAVFTLSWDKEAYQSFEVFESCQERDAAATQIRMRADVQYQRQSQVLQTLEYYEVADVKPKVIYQRGLSLHALNVPTVLELLQSLRTHQARVCRA